MSPVLKKPMRSAASFICQVIKPHKKWYIFASTSALLLVGAGLLQARLTEGLINRAAAAGHRDLLLLLVLFMLMLAAKTLISYVKNMAVVRMAAHAGKDLKQRISHSLIWADYREIIHLQSGNALQTMNADTAAVCSFLDHELIDLFSQFTMACGALIYLVWVNPLLAAVTFAFTPIGLLLTLTLNRKMNRLYPIRADHEGQALSVLEQVFAAIPVVKTFMAEKRIHDIIRKQYQEVCQSDIEISFWNALMQPACSATSMIPRILYLLFSGYLAINGRLSIGALIALFDLLSYIIGPTVYLPFMMNSLNRSIASINRIRKITGLAHRHQTEFQPLHGRPSIELDHVRFAHANDDIIRDLSFEQTGSGLVVLCGRSGSGKTSLIDLIAGLYVPDEGNITVHGGISVFAQDTWLFTGTILDNVRVARQDASPQAAWDALKRTGAETMATIHALGDQSLLGDGHADLSGGQLQQLALARLILADAPIWLMDEPTSALDAETEKLICDVIKEASSEKLIIAATHRPALMAIADRRIDL